MSDKTSEVTTILSKLGLDDPRPLTAEQEQQLELALDPELKRLQDIQDLYTDTSHVTAD